MKRERSRGDVIKDEIWASMKKERGLTKAEIYFLYDARIEAAMRYFSPFSGIYSAAYPPKCRYCQYKYLCSPDDECPYGRNKTFA